MTLRLWPLMLPLLLSLWSATGLAAEPDPAATGEATAADMAVPTSDAAADSSGPATGVTATTVAAETVSDAAARTDAAATNAVDAASPNTSSDASDDDAEPALSVRIADPYIDLHTGPGRGYPKFQIVERGGQIELLSRRTDWFLVRTARGHEGWVHREQLLRTLTADGEAIAISEATQDDFAAREWELGVMAGLFQKADVISVYGAWGFTENLSLELTLAHVMGDFSNAKYATLHLTHQPFPEWWISPYFQLGTGYIRTDPAATIIQTEDRSEQLTHVGVGARTYLTRRFVLRVEYNNYVVLTDRNDNEKVEEWKAGFSLFF